MTVRSCSLFACRCPGQPAVDMSKVLDENDGVFPVDQPSVHGELRAQVSFHAPPSFAV